MNNKDTMYLMAETTKIEEIPIAIALSIFLESDGFDVSKINCFLLDYYADNRDSWEEDLYV